MPADPPSKPKLIHPQLLVLSSPIVQGKLLSSGIVERNAIDTTTRNEAPSRAEITSVSPSSPSDKYKPLKTDCSIPSPISDATTASSVLGKPSSTSRKRPADDSNDMSSGTLARSSKRPRHTTRESSSDDGPTQVDTAEAHQDVGENVDNVRSRSEAEIVAGDALYEQHKVHIEASWGANPGTRKREAQWEKVLYWQALNPKYATKSAKDRPKPAEAVDKASRDPVSAPNSRLPTPAFEPVEPSQDYEDREDPATWTKHAGRHDRYRCGHRNPKCFEGTCNKGRYHLCCKDGVDFRRNRESLKRRDMPQPKTKKARNVSEEDKSTKDSDLARRKATMASKKAAYRSPDTSDNTNDSPGCLPAPGPVPQQTLPISVPLFAASWNTITSQSATPPLPSSTTPATVPNQSPSAVNPTIVQVSPTLRGYHRDAECVERMRPQNLQDWTRFNSWWDASFRQAQGYALTDQEKSVLQQPEPSTETSPVRKARLPAPVAV